MGNNGVKYGTEQKQPNRKYKGEKKGYNKTPRMQTHDLNLPTIEGDLGVLGLGHGSDIPKMSKASTRSGNGKTNDVSKMRSIMKAQGMLI